MSLVNAVLVRPGQYNSLEELEGLMEDFSLEACATPPNEAAEKFEIRRRLGWTDAVEMCKFYDDQGTDSWYYFAYADTSERERRPDAFLAPQRGESWGLSVPLCVWVILQPQGPGVTANMRSISRHMLCLRSGPLDDQYPTLFTKRDLAEAMWQYRNTDPDTVFVSRERSRFQRKFMGGLNLSSLGMSYGNIRTAPATGQQWRPPL